MCLEGLALGFSPRLATDSAVLGKRPLSIALALIRQVVISLGMERHQSDHRS
jgi:hypothetical protein